MYEEKLLHINREVKELRSRAESDARDLLAETKKRIEGLVREIRESGASREVVRKAKEEVEEMRERHKEKEPEEEVQFEGPVRVGMMVKLRGTGMAGEVIEVIDARRVVIDSAGKRVVAAINHLEITRDKPLALFKQNDFIDYSEASNEIDLRGMYGDESIELLDKFIDKAVLLRLTRIRIIHGKGTGTLRKRVSEYLSKNKNVSSFQLGEWNEGGGGVTVANLSV